MSHTINNKITEDILPSLQGVVPSLAATCSSDGIPNSIAVSQVFYVDETHVAISHQFFNKTTKNIQENPYMSVVITCPLTYTLRKLLLRFVESQKSGDIFERMKLQLEVIASMQNKEGLFVLQSADIFEIISLKILK